MVSVDGVGSVTDRKALARVLRCFHFIQHGDGEVSEGDPAFAVGAKQQVVLAQTELTGALALVKFGRWRQEGPVQVLFFAQCLQVLPTRCSFWFVLVRETLAVDDFGAIGQQQRTGAADKQ